MTASILLDSMILIDHFNGLDTATEYLRSTEDRAVVSVITRAEIGGILLSVSTQKGRGFAWVV